jgi:membrane-associated phospholipid phosphatase
MSGRRTLKLLAAMLLGFAVVLGCGIALGELLSLAERSNGSTSPDASITSWLVAHRSHGLTTLARVLSTLGSQIILGPLTAIVAAALLMRRRFLSAGMLVAAWGGAICLYSLTKLVVDRMRPPSAIWLTHVARTSSFPSGHATQSLATLTAIVLVSTAWVSGGRRAAWVLALVLAIMIGCSRVYLGVHWATDVASGWLIGTAWIAVSVWLVARWEVASSRSGDPDSRPHPYGARHGRPDRIRAR